MKTPHSPRSPLHPHALLRRVRRTALLALTLALIAPANLLAQRDDFNDGDDSGWLRYDPISSLAGPQDTWSFPSGKYRLQAAPTPNAALGPGRVGSLRQDVSYSNFHLEVDVVDWNPTRTNAFGLMARVQPNPAIGALYGYIFGYVNGDNYLALVRVDRESTKTISGSLPFPIVLTPGHGYRLTFTGEGAQLIGRLYDLGDLEHPLAEVPASDSVYAEGTAGLVAFGISSGALGPVDVTFDNYAATDRARPRLQGSCRRLLSTNWSCAGRNSRARATPCSAPTVSPRTLPGRTCPTTKSSWKARICFTTPGCRPATCSSG